MRWRTLPLVVRSAAVAVALSLVVAFASRDGSSPARWTISNGSASDLAMTIGGTQVPLAPSATVVVAPTSGDGATVLNIGTLATTTSQVELRLVNRGELPIEVVQDGPSPIDGHSPVTLGVGAQHTLDFGEEVGGRLDISLQALTTAVLTPDQVLVANTSPASVWVRVAGSCVELLAAAAVVVDSSSSTIELFRALPCDVPVAAKVTDDTVLVIFDGESGRAIGVQR